MTETARADEDKPVGSQMTEPPPETPVDAGPVTAAAEAPDPLDPASYREDMSFADVGVETTHEAVPLCRPDKLWLFRVRPGAEWRRTVPMVLIPEGTRKRFYLVAHSMLDLLAEWLVWVTIYTGVTDDGLEFLFPVQQQDADGNWHDAHKAQHRAAQQAMIEWTNLRWFSAKGHYKVSRSKVEKGEPRWSGRDFKTLFREALADQVIDAGDHPVAGKLLDLG